MCEEPRGSVGVDMRRWRDQCTGEVGEGLRSRMRCSGAPRVVRRVRGVPEVVSGRKEGSDEEEGGWGSITHR